jgi:hypothetical protein
MKSIFALGDLLGPIREDAFFANYHRRKPLHVAQGAKGLPDLMSWSLLNRLLDLSAHWTHRSLHLMLDKQPIASEDYCREMPGPGGTVTLADPAKVQAWIDRGASLILNSIDTLSPSLQAVATMLEETLGSYVQANLYCSFAGHQGFDCHFDTHDVFVIHTEGEKSWRIYEGRVNAPISHPILKEPDSDFHRHNRGRPMMEVRMAPGDLLYIPRGQYHEALATSTACIHLSFGVMPLRGIDLLPLLERHCAADSVFREDLPTEQAGAGNALADHLARLSDRMAALLQDPEMLADLAHARRDRRGLRGSYRLPIRQPSQAYRLVAGNLRVIRGEHGYVLRGSRQGVPLPPGAHRFVDWILAKRHFTRADLDAEFRELDGNERSAWLDQLEAMKVIEKMAAPSSSERTAGTAVTPANANADETYETRRKAT